jgi:uncharacterized protein YbjT (DUF2867 family)
VAAFLKTSPQVRAYVRRPEAAEELRKLGAKVAVGEMGDTDRLEAVMSGAHTVCHLVGSASHRTEEGITQANLDPVRHITSAAVGAGVRRLLYASCVGASPVDPNPYLRAKGLAEAIVRASGLEYVIVRSTLVLGPGAPWLEVLSARARDARADAPGSGKQVFAPVWVGDLAAALAAADDRERLLSGTWALEGPDRVTMAELLDRLAGRRGPKPSRWPGVFGGGRRGPRVRPSPSLEQLLTRDSVADAPDAAAEFGIARTRLDEGLGRSLPA